MTVSTTDSVVEYVSGGPAFPIPYRFLQNSDIEAVLFKQDGNSETLTGAQYTLSGAGGQSGGTLTSAYAASVLATPGASLIISRIMSPVQPTDLRNQGKFLAETHEGVFDRLTMLIQQGYAGVARALMRPIGKSYFDAESRRIANVADPVEAADAVNNNSMQVYVGGVLGAIQGPINNSANVLYVTPGGVPKVVQDASDVTDPMEGAALIGRAIRYISSKAELRSLVPQYSGERVYMVDPHTDLLSLGAGGHGVFKWQPGSMTAQVSGDPLGGLYVARASDPTGATGAWVREWDGERWDAKWWGFDAGPRGINSVNLPVSLQKNRVGATQDCHVLLYGDSHGWGQGAPDSQIWTTAELVSVHSANLYNKGFMARLESDIRARRGFATFTYGAYAPTQPSFIRPGFYGPDAVERGKTSSNGVLPLIPICGTISGSLQTIVTGAVTNLRFYTPTATGALTYPAQFREKLETGLFGRRRLKLNLEQLNDFKDAGKTEYFQISANPSRNAGGAGFTTYSNPGGGVYAETVNATSQLSVHTSHFNGNLPAWMAVASLVFVPGYGLARVQQLTAVAGGTDIVLTSEAGAALGGTSFVRCLRDGMRFYHPAYVQKAIYKLPMQAPARVAYVAVLHKVGGGMLDLYFCDNLNSGGAGNDPAFNGAARSLSATGWSWAGRSDIQATISGPGADVLPAPRASKTATYYRIDTSTSGAQEEIVYRIDFGTAQFGDLYLEASGGECEIRGVVLDNNKVVNLSMGGHTVGAWLGEEASAQPDTADHVTQILSHTPVQPSHVITQIPFVNEFIKQTPIATFKTRLQTFVDRHKNHLPLSNNFNAKGVNFLFFTSLRNREILFGVATEPGVKYSDYVQATREFCAANGHGFIDCEAALVGKVRSGQIDAERLFCDSNHPSDYANELIYEELRKTIEAII